MKTKTITKTGEQMTNNVNTNNFLFKKAYLKTEPFEHITYLVQIKDERFFNVTDDQKGNIEIYKYKDGSLDFEYVIFGQNFKNVNDAFKYLNNLKGAN